MKTIIKTVLAATVLFAAASSNAAVVYENGAPNGYSGNEMSDFVQSEDFRLDSAASIGSASFYAGGTTDATSLTYYIFGAGSDQPGALLTSGNAQNLTRMLTGQTAFGTPEALYSFDFASAFTAAANTTYWLGLRAAGNTNPIFWETTDANATLQNQESLSGTFDNWTNSGQERSFSLSTAAVPEPATWATMLVGFGMMGFALRRRQRNVTTTVAYAAQRCH